MRLAQPSDHAAVARFVDARCDWLEAKSLPFWRGARDDRVAQCDNPEVAQVETLLISVALCVVSIAATLTGMADGKAATASARSQQGGAPGTAPGIGAPRERYVRWCGEQGREPYPFGRAG